jgi:amidophosphoribosyltransferase
LVLGRTEDAHVVASETCALDTIGAELVREVEPGEFLMINEEGLHSRSIANDRDEAFCVFEFVYFARPDSNFAGANVHHVRKELGRVLARRYPVEADVVTGVPDSSLSAATGYAEEAGIPYEMGLIKNRYIGRTFIQPSQEARARGVKIKLNPIRQILQGNRVVLVDDSIVRGTTSKHLIKLFREAGATEVHVRISSAPYRHSCYYGIDTPDSDQLLAHGRSVDEVCELIGADSLAYLTVEDMVEATGVADRVGFCSSCFSGDYPVKPEDARQGLEVEERGRGVQ